MLCCVVVDVSAVSECVVVSDVSPVPVGYVFVWFVFDVFVHCVCCIC